MILEYHRPKTLEEALVLLSREQPVTKPLVGGSVINRPTKEDFAVVDLQSLGLNLLEKHGHILKIGATVTLQEAINWIASVIEDRKVLFDALKHALNQECSYNLRQIASIAGTLVAANGRSSFTTCCLALDAEVQIYPHMSSVSLGDLLPLRHETLKGKLIIHISLPANVSLRYASVARTPSDRPIVCVAVAAWNSGRRRIALGGFGEEPVLAFDGNESQGADVAARSVYAGAGDEWASADYRSRMAALLTQRCLNELMK